MQGALFTFAVLAALLAAQSIASLRDGFRFLRYLRENVRREPGNFVPPAALIIPCKGVDPGFESNIQQFINQDYPDYELILVVASEDDPACRVLNEIVGVGLARLSAKPERATQEMPLQFAPGARSREVKIVIAGHSNVRGEKVNNLLHGLAAVDPRAEILAFADADGCPHTDWLRSLVAPLADPAVTVSTGFRWYLPGASWVSKIRAVWDTSIATLLGEHRKNFAWGGSMALRVADFKRLEIAERYWARTVSDDYGVTRAVRDAGGWIRFEPRCLVASREDSSFSDFMKWANRQIIITRVYAARLWKLGLLAHGLYCATFILGVALTVSRAALWPANALIAGALAAILCLGLLKGRIRAVAARELFPEERESLARWGANYWRLQPIVPWMMLVNFVTAGFMRRIEWRGTRYDLVSENEVRVVSRDDS